MYLYLQTHDILKIYLFSNLLQQIFQLRRLLIFLLMNLEHLWYLS